LDADLFGLCDAEVGGRSEVVLATLDESMEIVSSPLAAQYWTSQATELAQMETTETPISVENELY